MSEAIKNNIVVKSSDIEIHPFNSEDEFVVTVKSLDRRIAINKKTKKLLDIVDNKKSLQEVVNTYNKEYPNEPITLETANAVFFENLLQCGIIINEDFQPEKNKIASYLSLSFTIIPKEKLQFFTNLLSGFYNFNYFYTTLITCFVFVATVVFYNREELINFSLHLPFLNWIAFLLITLFILFFHEFGHATTCKKLGAEPGSIGFGFYLLKPVMFADVSDIWKLNQTKRMYVNFAGVYTELLIASVLSVIYLFTKQTFLLLITSSVLISFFINLNPFLRYDGYWILSDVTNTPNLRKVSNSKLKNFFNSFVKGKIQKLTSKEILLVVYGFISLIAIFLFFAYALYVDANSIISYPLDIYTLLKNFFNGNTIEITELSKFILPTLFYYFLYRYIKSKL